MTYLRQFFLFWFHFIVGDDWMLAAGAVAALAVSASIARQGFSAWWVMPVAVALLLAISIWREIKSTQ